MKKILLIIMMLIFLTSCAKKLECINDIDEDNIVNTIVKFNKGGKPYENYTVNEITFETKEEALKYYNDNKAYYDTVKDAEISIDNNKVIEKIYYKYTAEEQEYLESLDKFKESFENEGGECQIK